MCAIWFSFLVFTMWKLRDERTSPKIDYQFQMIRSSNNMICSCSIDGFYWPGMTYHSIACKSIDWDGVLNNHVRAYFKASRTVWATLCNYHNLRKNQSSASLCDKHTHICISISTNCWLNNYNYVLCVAVCWFKKRSTQNNECFVDDDNDDKSNHEGEKSLRIIKKKEMIHPKWWQK